MTAPTHSTSPPSGILGRWNAIPLYFRILLAMAIGVVVAMMLGERAAFLEIPSTIILQLLGALAPPLILVAVVHVLMTSEITGKTAARLAGLLLLNTLVAIIIGLTVANVMQPGKSANIPPPPEEVHEKASGPFAIFMDSIPKSIVGPLGDQANVIHLYRVGIWHRVLNQERAAVTNAHRLCRDCLRDSDSDFALDHPSGAVWRVCHRCARRWDGRF